MSRHLFPSLSLALLMLGLVAAEVPSYIHVCGRKNPELSKCVMESVNNLRPVLKTGMPDLDIPTFEPMEVDEVALANLTDFHAVATNVKLWGLTNFTIKHLIIDLEKQFMDLELHFDQTLMDAEYDVKAKILVPVNEKGPISTTSNEVTSKLLMKFQTVNRRGKKLIYFTSATTKLTITGYTANFKHDVKSNPVSEAINSILVNNQKELIASMSPSLEKAISEKILIISNGICKHFTYDELFPDHE